MKMRQKLYLQGLGHDSESAALLWPHDRAGGGVLAGGKCILFDLVGNAFCLIWWEMHFA